MKSYPTKPCRFCGARSHFPYTCWKNPKKHKYIKKLGKYGKQWIVTRRTWYRKHPPIRDPYPHYICYLAGHGEWLRPPEYLAGLDNPIVIPCTLDHVLSKGRHPELRDVQWDLKPCCPQGNRAKGSKDGVLEVS